LRYQLEANFVGFAEIADHWRGAHAVAAAGRLGVRNHPTSGWGHFWSAILPKYWYFDHALNHDDVLIGYLIRRYEMDGGQFA
jgi:hypothetical protein